MRHVVISPHHDDAVFSLGETLFGLRDAGDDVLVVTPTGGVPSDERGRAKALLLSAEHGRALEFLGASRVEWPFLDDCYPLPSPLAVAERMAATVAVAEVLWLPVGVHHPDHVLYADAAVDAFLALSADERPALRVYEELPYRVLYPRVTIARLDLLEHRLGGLVPLGYPSDHPGRKEALVGFYESQAGADLLRCLFVPERPWRAV